MNSENLSYNTVQGPLNGELEVPTSKSYANRVLVLAALNEKPVTISNIPESSDVANMISCFKKIGLDIQINGNEVTIRNSFPECEKDINGTVSLKTGDGGTTNRFLIPLLALGRNKYQLIPAEKMSERPMDEMKNILGELGVTVFNDGTWFSLQGPYKTDKSKIHINCAETTQFATGFMLSLQKIAIEVIEKNLKTSIPYLNMTKELVKQKQQTYEVPVDFSSLSYPLALAAFSGDIVISNCKEVDQYQADSVFVEILSTLGVDVKLGNDGLKLKGISEISNFDIDCSACPDLVPTLCFVASYSKGRSVLQNVEVLKYKECDRLTEMLRIMSLFQVKASYDSKVDALIINGREPHNESVEVKTERDHRMVMISHLFQRMNGGGVLHDIDCVKKSFPRFFEVMN